MAVISADFTRNGGDFCVTRYAVMLFFSEIVFPRRSETNCITYSFVDKRGFYAISVSKCKTRTLRGYAILRDSSIRRDNT